ncbi:ParB/RepB/Spo0J family partition protein [Asanoa hainanensis]|nr:ParB/RepB/Spo0J family partition protein [Asanoa hainanensis]
MQNVIDEAPTTAPGKVVQDLPIDAVSPHPGNSVSRLEVDDDFVESIRQDGVKSPGQVIPVATYVRTGGDVSELHNPKADYVIVWGARRWAGSKAAGRETYPAIVEDRDISATDIIKDRILENIHRLDLSEIEEAEQYHLLMLEYKSQRKVAQVVKKSQAHVSRRLRLLDLPEDVQQALHARKINSEIANGLGQLGPERVAAALAEMLAVAGDDEEKNLAQRREILDRVKRTAAQEQRVADARAKAHAAGITVLDDPVERFGSEVSLHRLDVMSEVDAAKAAGDLAAQITSNGDTYYFRLSLPEPAGDLSLAEPGGDGAAPADAPGADPRQRSEATDANAHPVVTPGDAGGITAAAGRVPRARNVDVNAVERRAAAQARAAACRRLAASVPARDQVLNRLVSRMLSPDHNGHAGAARLAAEWLRANNIGPADLSDGDYVAHMSAAGDLRLRTHFAYALDLALDEMHVAKSLEWSEREVAHLRRLQDEAEYEPTPWEMTQLLAAPTPSSSRSETGQ